MQNGAHLAHRETETALPVDVVALLKTQDASYVQAQLRAETKRIAELEQRIASMLPHLRAEWLADKPERAATLRAAKLLPDVVREEGTVGAMGKKTVWCEGGRDEGECRCWPALLMPCSCSDAPACSAQVQSTRCFSPGRGRAFERR